jgi:Actinobacteria/chloroflexi VLRF1 release factor
VTARPAAGGGRWLEVAPARLEHWLEDFDRRHSVLRTRYSPAAARFEAADGAVAECDPPFPPMAEAPDANGLEAGPLLAHARRARRVGVILARLGGHAVGVFDGDLLVASKVGSRPVHGRHAAGGWSQQRFARRREGQARRAAAAAAADAARVLLPELGALDAVVLGGDRGAVDALRPDRRLSPVFEAATDRFLAVPDPRLAVLRRTPALFTAVRVRLLP